MESVTNKVEEIQNIDFSNNDLKNLAEAVKKLEEVLDKLGVTKKPEYTKPPADTIGRGFYLMNNKV